MENKFESIIRGRKLEESKEDISKLSQEELQQRRNNIIKHLTGNFTEKEVDKQTNPTVKRLLSEIQEIDKYLESKEVKVEENFKEQLTEDSHRGKRAISICLDVIIDDNTSGEEVAQDIANIISDNYNVQTSSVQADCTDKYKDTINNSIYEGLDIQPFRPFNKYDWYSYQGISSFKSGDEPLVYVEDISDSDQVVIIIGTDYDTGEIVVSVDTTENYDTTEEEITMAAKFFDDFKSALEFGKKIIGYEDIINFVKNNKSEFDEVDTY